MSTSCRLPIVHLLPIHVTHTCHATSGGAINSPAELHLRPCFAVSALPSSILSRWQVRAAARSPRAGSSCGLVRRRRPVPGVRCAHRLATAGTAAADSSAASRRTGGRSHPAALAVACRWRCLDASQAGGPRPGGPPGVRRCGDLAAAGRIALHTKVPSLSLCL